MELSTEIATITENAVKDLNRTLDFQVFTGHSYDRYSKMVEAGHIREEVTNIRTGTSQPERAVADLLLRALDAELPQVALYLLVSRFEVFFFDLLAAVLTHRPHKLSPDMQVKVSDVVGARDKAALLTTIVEREVANQSYKKPFDWFKYLAKVIEARPATEENVERFAELKATRDILIHNGGIINETYLEKAGLGARGAPGESVPLSRPYVYEAGEFLRELVESIGATCLGSIQHAAQAP